MKSKMDWLVGSWQADAGYIPVLFTLNRTATGFRIRAIDQSDNEELRVSKIKWDGRVLTFETFTPSNGWRTRNSVKPISRTRAIHELTMFERWKKVRT